MEKDKRKFWLALLGIVIIIVLVIVFILTNGHEIHTSDDKEEQSVSALVCDTGNHEGAMFYSTTANTVTNEIKVSFSGNRFSKLFYEYKGVYRSHDLAHAEEARMHADYNIYMGENNIEQMSLTPSYAVSGNKFNITLYADDFDLINRVTSKLFYIDSDDVEKFKNYSIEEMQKYYEGKDFTCRIVE